MGAAASDLADDLAGLPATGTSGAAQVEQHTDALASTIAEYVKKAQASLAAWEAGTGSEEQTLSLVGSQLRALRASLASTTAAIRTLDPVLNAAIDESTSCQSLIESLNSQ